MLVRMRRQNDNCGFWDLLLNLSCRLKAVDQRHGDIQYDDIRPHSLNLFYCFRSVLSFSDDLKMRMLLQRRTYHASHNRVIVGDHYSDPNVPGWVWLAFMFHQALPENRSYRYWVRCLCSRKRLSSFQISERFKHISFKQPERTRHAVSKPTQLKLDASYVLPKSVHREAIVAEARIGK